MGFIAVGLVGLAVHTATFTTVASIEADRSLAWFAGLILATLVTWTLNRKLNFAASGRSRRAEIARYAFVTLVAQAVSFTVFHLACRAAPQIWPQAWLLTGAAVATFFSYTGQRYFTFAQQPRVGYGA